MPKGIRYACEPHLQTLLFENKDTTTVNHGQRLDTTGTLHWGKWFKSRIGTTRAFNLERNAGRTPSSASETPSLTQKRAGCTVRGQETRKGGRNVPGQDCMGGGRATCQIRGCQWPFLRGQACVWPCHAQYPGAGSSPATVLVTLPQHVSEATTVHAEAHSHACTLEGPLTTY